MTKGKKVKKVLYMTMLWGFGGIEKYMLNIFDHIDRTEYTFDVALPGNFKHENEDSLIDRDINVIHYAAESIGQQIKEIKQILDAGDYDIVHVMQGYVTLETYAVFALVAIAERRKHRYKVICHAHGIEDKTKQCGGIKRTLRAIYRSLLRKGFSGADLLVGCSHEAAAFLYGKHNDLKVFYNGIDLGRFMLDYPADTLTGLKKFYSIEDGLPKFITVARMSDEKNPIFLLNIIKHLRGYYPRIKFFWVGDGELRCDIVRYIENNGLSGHVFLLGNQKHVNEILPCCDYFLLPSKREGAPLVLIEAQASGLKCFASDRVPNVVDCGGVTFIPLAKTAEQWAEEIHRQIEAAPKANIDLERLNRFDINKTIADLSKVYDWLIGCL